MLADGKEKSYFDVMTEFCDDCPLRGKAMGCLVNLYVVNNVNKLTPENEWVNLLGNPIGVLIDEE
jgi:hypothetical protein